MGRGVRVALSMLVAMGVYAPVQADIYSFEDANGVIHFSNVPADARYEVTLREPVAATPRKGRAGTAVRRTGETYRPIVEQAAREHDVDPALLRAVITVESAYDPDAVSPKGAVGLMQLMPAVAQRYGVSDRRNPRQNIYGGARYLQALLDKFEDVSLALAAYNAGEDAVAHYGNRIPPFPETLSYVPKVMELYRRYQPESP